MFTQDDEDRLDWLENCERLREARNDTQRRLSSTVLGVLILAAALVPVAIFVIAAMIAN